MNIPSVVASELGINIRQVESVVALFKEEATIPFIARYRKELTGGLDEEVLRKIEER
jgi:protein Tex